MASPSNFWQDLNFFSLLLYPISLIFCFLVMLRRFFYRQQIFTRHSFSAPVVIVGNISVGGNGKTPLVIHLVEALRKKGYRPGVVSRGYGAKNPELKNGKTLTVDCAQDVSLFGDEPWMIAVSTKAPVVVGINRVKAVETLIQQHDCDIVVSDDGMQHYAMQRNYEICVVDGDKLFGNQLCLPAGPLRERTSRLNQVDLIIYNGATKKPINSYPEKTCFMQLEFQQLVPLNQTEREQSLQLLQGQKVHAVAGIGQPSRFFQQLTNCGLDIIEHPYEDHHHYSSEDVIFADDLAVIMTEKDAVKCRNFVLDNSWYIPVKAVLTDDVVKRIIAKL